MAPAQLWHYLTQFVSRSYPRTGIPFSSGRFATLQSGKRTRGADRLAGAIARARPDLFLEEQHVVTDWGSKELGTFDRVAGHRRNQRMVDAGAQVCLAFPAREAKNAGTWSCAGKAKVAGMEVRVFFDKPADVPTES